MSVARKSLSFAIAICTAVNFCAADPPGLDRRLATGRAESHSAFPEAERQTAQRHRGFPLARPSGGDVRGESASGAELGLPRSIVDELPPGCVQNWGSAPDSRERMAVRQPPSPNISSIPVLTPVEQRAAERLAQLHSQRVGSLSRPADDLLAGDSDLLDDDLLGGAVPSDKDPLTEMGRTQRDLPAPPHGDPDNFNPHAGATSALPLPVNNSDNADPHRELLAEDQYPSAQTCAKCHPQHYKEWSVSGHAYAMVSPMFQRFEQKITELTQGTVGHFCIRCHGPVAVQMEYPRDASILDAPRIVREGITCVACHRVNKAYGRTDGLRRIEPGDIHQPVYSGAPGSGLSEAVSRRQELKLKIEASDKGPGQSIHSESRPFEPISRSDFCASCHQVAVHPGIWLEIVHAQYRSGPAAAKGISCQDCHMGQVPGKPYGYAEGHVAELNGRPYGQPRKTSNHQFWGPGYSIAHPGLFPMNPKADRWSPREWLAFDDRSDWGKDQFEKTVAPQLAFPPPWDHSDDRRDARKVLEENARMLNEARAGSVAAMEAAAAIVGPIFDAPPVVHQPLRFRYRVHNVSEGHNFPTGSLGAQPQVWLNVVLIGPSGQRVWESGYLDTHGDLADLQSIDVATGTVPRDAQLFNLQTKFLINSLKGTDREVALPLNFNLDQLVFFRPGAVPVRVLNHPPLIRMEAQSIPPLGSRVAGYQIPAERMREPGPYRLSVRLRSRVEPSYFMRMVDSTPDMIRRMNEGILDIHPSSHTFFVK